MKETWQHYDGGIYIWLKWQDLAALYVYYNGSASRRRALQREFMTIRGMVGRILRSVMTIGRMVGRMEWSFDQQGMVGRTRRELMSIDIDGVVTMLLHLHPLSAWCVPTTKPLYSNPLIIYS